MPPASTTTNTTTTTAAAPARTQQWQATIRQDLDYHNLSATDYAAIEADLQRRPITHDEVRFQNRMYRAGYKLVFTVVLLFLFLLIKVFRL